MKKTITHSIIITFLLFLIACDKNEYAPNVSDYTFSVEENSETGTVVGTIEAADLDEGQIISYEIIDGNSDAVFQINPLTGDLTISNPQKLNYEEVQEFNIKVAASDNHPDDPKEAVSNVSIKVLDINEFAPQIEDQNFTVNENSISGLNIGQVIASDLDIYQSLTFSISAIGDSGFVSIDSLSGMLIVSDSSAFDYEERKKITIVVEVSDNEEPPLIASDTLSIEILDVREITDGLLAYYPFNGNADDETGNGYDGTEFSSMNYVEGVIGQAKDFDGTSDYIQLANTLDASYGLTFSFWIYSRGTNGSENAGTVVCKYDMAANSRSFLINSYGNLRADNTAPNTLMAAFYPYGHINNIKDWINTIFTAEDLIPNYDVEPYTFVNPMSLPDNQWVHCVINVTETEVQAWINNSLSVKKRREHEVYHNDNSAVTFIGNCPSYYQGSNNHLNGYLDELRIYNRSLSEDEIWQLFELR